MMQPVPPAPPRTAFHPERAPRASETDPLNFNLPAGAQIPVPSSQVQNFRFSSRYGRPINVVSELLADKVTRRYVVTGGLIVNVGYGQGRGQGELEFATDEAVIWVRGQNADTALSGFESTP